MTGMDLRRGRRPSIPPLWRRAASAAALLAVLALPVAAGLIEMGPPAPAPPARATPPSTGAWSASTGDMGGAPEPSAPSELPPSAPAQPAVALARPNGSGIAVPILTYHWIRTNPVPSDQLGFHLSVTPQHFAEQMAFLHFAGVHPITLGDAMSALQAGKPLPPRPVILTFDDGYGDFASRATPVLQQYGFVATDFVVSGFINRPAYMTLDQIHQVEAAGMVVGCHTVNHLDLARVPAAVAQAQITVSHQQLEHLLGHKVLDFAYPYGAYDAQVEKMVLADGFRDAVTTTGGTWLQVGTRGAWPRLAVDGGDDLAAFAAKALAGTPAATVHQLLQGFAAHQAQSAPAPTPSVRVATDEDGTDLRRAV
jgi:peptidoglycan/xylan/chitin deacetylase (PgdA/CDA1 family)